MMLAKSNIFLVIIIYMTILSLAFAQNDFNPELTQLKEKIEQGNFEPDHLRRYYYLVRNSRLDLKDEEKFAETLDESFVKDFILALVKIKRYNYSGAFNVLSSAKKVPPNLYEYYDILVETASASSSFDQLAEIINSHKIDITNINYLLGRINYAKSNFNRAEKNFMAVLLADTAEVNTLYWLAYTKRQQGDYPGAAEFLAKCIEVLDKKNPMVSQIINAQGSLYYLSGDYDNAGAYYNEALKKSEQLANSREKIKALMNLALIDDDYGETESAREKYYAGLSLAKKINDLELEAMCLSELGVSFTYSNELIDAKTNYVESLDKYTKLGNKSRMSLLAANLGRVYLSLLNYNKAREYFNYGIEQSGESKRAAMLNLLGLGDLYANLSNYSKAFGYYEQAREISVQIKDLSSKAEIDVGMGVMYFNLENFREALRIFKLLESEINSDEQPYLTADLFHKMGIAYFELNNFEAAENYLNKSIQLSIVYQDILSELNSKAQLASLLLKSGKKIEAKRKIKKLIKEYEEYGFSQQAGILTLQLSKIYMSENKNSQAVKSLLRAKQFASDANDAETSIQIFYSLAELAQFEKKYQEAKLDFEEAIRLIDIVSRPQYKKDEMQISFFAKYDEVFNSYADFLIKHNEQKQAFEALEQSRGRNTYQNLLALKMQNELGQDSLLTNIFELEWEQLNFPDNKCINEKSEKTKRELSEKYPGRFSDLFMTNKLSLSQIQEGLDKNEFILSPFIADDYSIVYLIGHDIFEPTKIDIEKNDLIELVKNVSPFFDNDTAFNKIYYNQDLFAFNTRAAFEIYNKLFRTSIEKIPSETNLIFVLPEELISIPMEFLVTRFGENEYTYNYSDKHFLINNFNISYSPSVSIYLKQKNESKSISDNILVLGNPQIGNVQNYFGEVRYVSGNQNFDIFETELTELKYSIEEIESISSMFEADLTLSGESATEALFKEGAPGKSVIHLATHSLLHKDRPVILFSQNSDGPENGLLETGEIVGLDINSEMVVLSSCRSGLGIIDRSEGVLGMQKAFFEAGCKSIVVSLWDISDKYTAEFMKLFYKHLSDGRDKSNALRLAKLDFINQVSPNPYYWSAFVLSGNTSELNLIPQRLNIVLWGMILLVIVLTLVYFKKRPLLYNSKSNN